MFAKVRLKDALPVEKSGIARTLRRGHDWNAQQQFPLGQSDLLSQIATCDLHTHVPQILTRKAAAMLEVEFFRTLEKYEHQYSIRSRAGLAHYSS